MKLIILRHGKAHQHSPTGRDEDRGLKRKGIRQAEYVAGVLGRRGPMPELILASPAERARHTGAIVAGALGVEARMEPTLGLDASATGVIELLASHQGRGALLFVGHNPTLSGVASVLSRTSVSLRTGEAFVCTIDPDDTIGSATNIGLIRLEEP